MRLAIISDIHEDLTSLTNVLKKIEKLGCDEIVCLGDICGFSIPYYKYYQTRDANECVRLIKDNCKYSVIGNHDLFAIKKLPENIDSFDFPANWYKLNYFEKLKISNDKVWLNEENELEALLDDDNIDYLNNLPEFIRISLNDKDIFFSHYLYPDITGSTKDFIYEKNKFMIHYLKFKTKDKNTLFFFGHMHPHGIIRVDNEKMFVKRRRVIASENIYGICGPAVTKNEQLNGFIVFDTDSNLIIPYYKGSIF